MEAGAWTWLLRADVLIQIERQVLGGGYEGPGFTLLEIPNEDLLAYGTADLIANVAAQARLSGRLGSSRGPYNTGHLWRRVRRTARFRRLRIPAAGH